MPAGLLTLYNLFSTLPVFGQFFIVYLTSTFLARFLPETITFFLIGSGLLQAKTLELSAVFTKLIPVIIIFYSFFLGLNFPWHQANLFRKKLYRTTFAGFLLITGLNVLLYYAIIKNNLLPNFIDNFSGIIFYLIAALIMVAFLEINKTTLQKKANGPLAGMTSGSAVLFNLLVLFLLPAITEQLTLTNLAFSAAAALGLFLIIKLLTRFVYPQKKLSLQITTLLLLVMSIYFIKELNIFIFPALTGVFFSLKKDQDQQQLLPAELIHILKNIIIIGALSYLQYTPAILWLTGGYFLYKQFVFRIVFFILGKNLHLSESVYQHLGSALATQGVFFISFIIYLNIPEKNISTAVISVIIFCSVIENTLHNFIFARNLRKAGEI